MPISPMTKWTAAAAISGAMLVAGCSGSVGNEVAAPNSSPTPTAFFSTPGAGTWTVPAGITSIRLIAAGANGGGDNQSSSGGAGAMITATRPVTPGETISFYIGAGGALFGGGGSTNVDLGSQYQIIAGGGGGGVGAGDAGGAGGAGEAGGGPYGIGGGGGHDGMAGAGGGPKGEWGIQPGGDGANGAGGAGGVGSAGGTPSAANGPGRGGDGAQQAYPNQPSGGGGGGGYGGGGGGGTEYMNLGGGGGGGSYVPSPGSSYDSVNYAKAPRNGNGPGSNGSLAIYAS